MRAYLIGRWSLKDLKMEKHGSSESLIVFVKAVLRH